MKSTKIRTALAALFGLACGTGLTLSSAAFAHGGPRPHGMKWTPEKMQTHLREMTQALNLSEAQQATIEEAFDKARAQIQTLEDQPFGHEKMLALRQIHFETEDALYATLSCEQREALRKLKREHRSEQMDAHWQRHHDEQ